MKKIICIGECSLNIVFDGAAPAGSIPGGRVAAAASLMAREGLPVVMASEASTDFVGDTIVKSLTDAGVDVSSVDRFTEGRSPLMIFSENPDGTTRITRYEDYTDDAFDIVWPRVDDDSVVIYGGYYTLDRRMRSHMVPFLNHCAERGAVMIYLPGFPAIQESRITRVMPAILENLELAHIVIARNNDMKLIFGIDSGSRCYCDHIDFYCRSMIGIDTACRQLTYYSGKEMSRLDIPEAVCETMTWNAGVVAGVAGAIFENGITPDRLNAPDAPLREQILTAAARSASVAARSLTQQWQKKVK